MTKYVIDAYAWIEYFNATKLGEKVKEIIEDKNNEIYTNPITLSELASSFERNNASFNEEKAILFSLSTIFQLETSFFEEAGKLHAQLKRVRKHMSMADVFVYYTAKKITAKVVTGDEDFRGLKEVIMLK
ncbi:MAG: PIN domain-containing protein [bacterium]|nr:PIN domain-containing protein [bacterium]